jgi:citrate lyase gamma subunit
MSSYIKPSRTLQGNISVEQIVSDFKKSGEFDKLKTAILENKLPHTTNANDTLVTYVKECVKQTVINEVMKNNTLISNRNRNQPSVITNIESEIAKTYGEHIQQLLKENIVDNEEIKNKIKENLAQLDKYSAFI